MSRERLATVEREIIDIKTSMQTNKQEEKQQIENTESDFKESVKKIEEVRSRYSASKRSDDTPDM